MFPFGSGRRGCPGTTSALQVVQTTLASMTQCFEFKLGDGKGITVDMTEAPGLTLPRAHSLICLVILSNFMNKTLEGEFADEKFSALLVFPDFTKSNSSWPETMGFLHSSGCGCRLTSSRLLVAYVDPLLQSIFLAVCFVRAIGSD
ncbi:Cytochrome p450 [Thalictrum thalictroides]|uniref:Cytochrome p450 n=1 Tax=Thalictrum thalictroides TaxID=46969 RepID=A0A7J6URQ3_THATH|nr:Cytochrome p450 [Thalictrum thalictroides]